MADGRPRDQRPRRRGGRRRLADVAALERRQRAVHELRDLLAPELPALVGADGDRLAAVERVRARARDLARAREAPGGDDLAEEALDEIFGLGPLEPVLRDPTVRRIGVVGAEIFAGEALVGRFLDPAHARRVVDRVLASRGVALEGDAPDVSVTMVDGSRLRARLHDGTLRVEIDRP